MNIRSGGVNTPSRSAILCNQQLNLLKQINSDADIYLLIQSLSLITVYNSTHHDAIYAHSLLLISLVNLSQSLILIKHKSSCRWLHKQRNYHKFIDFLLLVPSFHMKKPEEVFTALLRTTAGAPKHKRSEVYKCLRYKLHALIRRPITRVSRRLFLLPSKTI